MELSRVGGQRTTSGAPGNMSRVGDTGLPMQQRHGGKVVGKGVPTELPEGRVEMVCTGLPTELRNQSRREMEDYRQSLRKRSRGSGHRAAGVANGLSKGGRQRTTEGAPGRTSRISVHRTS